MDSNIYDKASTEKIPYRKFILSLTKYYPIWLQENRVERLKNIIEDTFQNEVKILGITDCLILRLVVVTGDFQNEVSEWSKQLGEEWRVSSTGAIGQSLTWGDGQPETTYSIIILSQDVALGLLEENPEVHNLSFGTLIHELAHIHDEMRYLCNIDPDPILKPQDWSSIRLFFAKSTWGEFFAEATAFPYLKNIDSNNYIGLCIDSLKDAIQTIFEETNAYKTHKIAGKVWKVASNKLSSVFNHLGRCLGYLHIAQQDAGNNNQIEQFLQEIYNLSPVWKNTTNCLYKELLNVNDRFNCDSFSHLSDVIDQSFRCVGLEPYKDPTN